MTPNPGSDEAIKWMPIKGFEGLYEISSIGLVKSLRYFGYYGKDGILKNRWSKIGIKNKGRYSHVRLIDKKRGIDKQFAIHRLVAINFIDNPFNKKEVNHIDGNTENNDYKNLEWVTSSENHKHAARNGLMSTRRAIEKIKENATKYNWIHEKHGRYFGSIDELVNKYNLSLSNKALLYKVSNASLEYKHYKYALGWRIDWTPGSYGAINKFSCSCPHLDNCHGKGFPVKVGKKTETCFWINAACPLHGIRKDNDVKKI